MVIINNPRVCARTIPTALHWEIGSGYDEIKASEGAEMYRLMSRFCDTLCGAWQCSCHKYLIWPMNGQLAHSEDFGSVPVKNS
jgi:hypothetical protein